MTALSVVASVTKGWCMFETKEAVQDTEYYGNKTTFLDFRPETFEKTTLHDGTVIYRFSKELLAYIETLVAFCPYHRQDDPRTAGALDEFYTAACKTTRQSSTMNSLRT